MDKSKAAKAEVVDSENIKIIEDIDLNALFKLTYNFDLLKGTLLTILNNQKLFQKQIENINKTNNEQNEMIESLKQNYLSKEEFSNYKKERLNDFNEQINHLDRQLTKSKNRT